MPIEPNSIVEWKAFLYVSGEMAADDASDFERLLLEDQAAREAVASAVELIQVVSLVGFEAGSKLQRPRRNQGRRLAAWTISIAAAAALFWAVLIPTFRAPAKIEADASQVALTWSGIRQGIDADWKAMIAGSHPVESNEASLAVETEEAVEPSNERPLPSWLLSAASKPRDDSSQEEN